MDIKGELQILRPVTGVDVDKMTERQMNEMRQPIFVQTAATFRRLYENNGGVIRQDFEEWDHPERHNREICRVSQITANGLPISGVNIPEGSSISVRMTVVEIFDQNADDIPESINWFNDPTYDLLVTKASGEELVLAQLAATEDSFMDQNLSPTNSEYREWLGEVSALLDGINADLCELEQ